MADIRIKDLPTTATQTASDDFIALDGTVNGTRKIDASAPSFKTSVTSPSVVAPAATNLTLTGGSTGASLVLGQGATGGATLVAGTSLTSVHRFQAAAIAFGTNTFTKGPLASTSASYLWLDSGSATSPGIHFYTANNTNFGIDATNALGLRFVTELDETGGSVKAALTRTGNLLIGGTTDITGSGGLKVFGTTAASSTTTGAVVIGNGTAGGLGVGGSIRAGSQIVSGYATVGGQTPGGAFTASSTDPRLFLNNTSAAADTGSWNFRSDSSGTLQISTGNDAVTAGTVALAFTRSTGTPTNANFNITTAASSSTVGALTIGNGTAATNVAIGGGNVNAGGTLTVGGAATFAGAVKIGGEATLSNTSSTQAALDLAGSATSNLVGYTSRTTRSSSSYGAYVRLDSSSLSGGVKYLLQSTGDLDTGGAGSFRLYNDTSGTTLLSVASTGAATFAGAVTATGNASTTAALRFDNQIGGGGTAQYYANYTAAATTIGRVLRGNGLAGYISNGLNIDNFGGFQIGLNVLGGSGESFKIRNAGTTDLLTITSAGITSLTNSTASTGAGTGALQVAGGIYAGAASYFGGAVTMPSAIVKRASTAADGFTIYFTGGTPYWEIGLQAVGTSNDFRIVNSQSGNRSLSISSSTEAATFAGLIFPQQAATAPTYVKGAIYFDTTLNKLRVGGATGWETITSV